MMPAWVRVLVVFTTLAFASLVYAGEPDSYLGPKPVREGSETLGSIHFRQALQAGTSWTSLLLSGYLSNAQLASWSADFTTRCSSIARRFSIGKSTKGTDLWVVEISANPGVVQAQPNFRYVANMHGDETSGRMLLPMLAEWLCANRNNDTRASRIINNMHLFLMPSMNPDGFSANSRANGAGTDLNRNFPSPFYSPCRGTAPEMCGASQLTPTANMQPETKAIMSWTLNPSFPFTFAANMHEGAVVVNYPWDGYDDGSTSIRGINNDSPDNAAYVYLSKVYSTAHPSMSRSNSFRDGITNGAGWYPIYGSMQDWDYTAGDCMEITLELSQRKRPSTSQLPALWRDNRDAMINLATAAALGGISGTVTSANGAPLTGATISVSGNTMATSARGPLAYYNKPSAPGTYTVTASAPGYTSVTATATVPANGQGVTRNFVLSA